MIASDPLSYVFLGCFLFSAFFLIISTLLGVGHGHIGIGGHTVHLPHLGSGHAVPVHAAPVHAATPHAVTAHASTHGAVATTSSTPTVTPLSSLRSLFLGSLNLYGILVLLLIFGLLGYLLHNFTNVGAEIAFVLALLAGVGGAVVVSSLLSSLFFDRESGVLGADTSQLEGRLGETSMSIREGGIGEVLYTTALGSRQSLGARSVDGEAIPAGTEIVILGVSEGIASVQTWDRFMDDVQRGSTPKLEPMEAD
jgi:uncharacterized membrane protein YeaQ/YmgE (transglycosylase-associated protein family)